MVCVKYIPKPPFVTVAVTFEMFAPIASTSASSWPQIAQLHFDSIDGIFAYKPLRQLLCTRLDAAGRRHIYRPRHYASKLGPRFAVVYADGRRPPGTGGVVRTDYAAPVEVRAERRSIPRARYNSAARYK